MPLLKNCCIMFDLKVGSKIIGIMSLISGIIGTLCLAIFVAIFGVADTSARTTHSLIEEHKKTRPTLDDEYQDANEEATLGFIQLIMNAISQVAIIVYVLFALCVLCIITSSCLIHGIKHDRRGLLIPYFVQEVLNVITIISVDIWFLVVLGSHSSVVIMVLSMLGFMLIHLYFAVVVFSQYQALGLIRMHEDISMK